MPWTVEQVPDSFHSRRAREAKATPAPKERASVDQDKRARRREERISSGVDDLQRWLTDLVRAGLAEAAARPWSSFEQMSARLVDAQAPGLAASYVTSARCRTPRPIGQNGC